MKALRTAKTKTHAAQASGRVVHSNSRAGKTTSVKSVKHYGSTTLGKKR